VTFGTTLSRRDLFTALVGAPLALSACQREPARVPGSIRGASLSAGHKLQRASDLAQASVERAEAARRTGTLIVGAGPSGLSAAWRLERLGIRDYLLLDLEPRPGGTSAFGDDGVVPYPWGAHYVPLPSADNRALVDLLSEVSALSVHNGKIEPSEAALVRAPEERVFADGHWQEGLVPASRLDGEHRRELARFEREVARVAAQRDAHGRRPFVLPLSRCSSDPAFTALDRLSAAQWLRHKGFVSSVVRWYVEYACRDDYGTSLERTSAWAMLFYFASRSVEGSGESAPFLTWPEGNGRVVRHLSAMAGERLLLEQLVTDVVPGEAGVDVAALDLRQNKLYRYSARHVVLAVPKFVAARVVRPLREVRPDFLSSFRTSPWLVANLHLRGRLKSKGFPLAWDNVLYDSPSLGYVVATHQALSDLGPTVLTYYRPFAELAPGVARRALAELDHESAATAILTDLGQAHPDLGERLERLDVMRFGHAMIAPLPGFIWGGDRQRAAAPLGRVRFAHSDLSGVALLEEAHYWGVKAAEDIARAEGRSFEPL
jgi:phytoene dehydrogenase-like protein